MFRLVPAFDDVLKILRRASGGVAARMFGENFPPPIHYTDMTCEEIDEDMLDEIVMGRAGDPDLIAHLGICLWCSERLVNYRARIEDLRRKLREASR